VATRTSGSAGGPGRRTGRKTDTRAPGPPNIEKVRGGGRVQRKAVVVAHAGHETGRREIIGLDIGAAETEAFCTEFLRSLVARGLVGNSRRGCRRSPRCSRKQKTTSCSSTRSRPNTDPSSGPPTRWNASTARSAAEPTSSASLPTTPQ
jgi:hypothetical protein